MEGKFTMSDSVYDSPYIKGEYEGTIRIRNQSTGEMEDRQIKRTVYRNASIDPDQVIPAGTKMGSEVTTRDMTNLERMQEGKSPVVCSKDAEGNTTYDKIELHHLTSTERNRGSEFFNGEKRDGTLVEIQGSVHDQYKKQLHAVNEPNNSFRKETQIVTDENGDTSRQKVKTYDATQYEKFRSQYWKDRAAEISQQRETQSQEPTSSESESTGGTNMDRWIDKSPQERQRLQKSQDEVAKKYRQFQSNNNSKKNSSGENDAERERVRTRTQAQDKGQNR